MQLFQLTCAHHWPPISDAACRSVGRTSRRHLAPACSLGRPPSALLYRRTNAGRATLRARYKLTSNSRLISAGERSTRCNIRTDNACSLSDDVSTSALATKLRATSVTTMSQKEVLEYCTYVSDSEKNSNSNRTVLRQSERLLHSQQR